MKAKISLGGILWQERQGVYRKMICPLARFNEPGGWSCGDWCPAFREPALIGRARNGIEDYFPGSWHIKLCEQVGTLYFDEIEDQRKEA
jgi:hypothetical protein